MQRSDNGQHDGISERRAGTQVESDVRQAAEVVIRKLYRDFGAPVKDFLPPDNEKTRRKCAVQTTVCRVRQKSTASRECREGIDSYAGSSSHP